VGVQSLSSSAAVGARVARWAAIDSFRIRGGGGAWNEA
jgi:hypothetical protein